MTMFKSFVIASFALLLTACGHGFEGEYESQAGSSNELLDSFAEVAGSQTVVIGSDYLDSEGRRTQFDAIFVRESGSERYLVFQSAAEEDVWKIIDDDTLMKGHDLMSLTLVRIR